MKVVTKRALSHCYIVTLSHCHIVTLDFYQNLTFLLPLLPEQTLSIFSLFQIAIYLHSVSGGLSLILQMIHWLRQQTERHIKIRENSLYM